LAGEADAVHVIHLHVEDSEGEGLSGVGGLLEAEEGVGGGIDGGGFHAEDGDLLGEEGSVGLVMIGDEDGGAGELGDGVSG
jgi:hypothetical protein